MVRRHQPRTEPTPTPPPEVRTGYFETSTRPLAILLVLAPTIVLAELLSLGSGTSTGSVGVVAAKAYLSDLFASLGAAGRYLPPAAMIATLVTWAVMSRDRARVRAGTLLAMPVEAAALAIPLLVLGMLLDPSASESAAAPLASMQDAGVTMSAVPWQSRLAIALSAGLYEEFLFRMIGLAVVHSLCRSVIRLKDGTSVVVAVVVTSVAFALYHDLTVAAGAGTEAGFDVQLATFYAIAGAYLGVVYLLRGLGISVLTHAAYNSVVLLVLFSPAPVTP